MSDSNDVAPCAVPLKDSENIDKTFRDKGCIDLCCNTLDSRVLGVSDEWFAPAKNILKPNPPEHRPNVLTESGIWYDGWETRRHNSEEFDWAVIRLGLGCASVFGVEIDTTYFDGNHASSVAVQGWCGTNTFSTAEDVKGDEKNGKVNLTPEEKKLLDPEFTGWKWILQPSDCDPNQRNAWKITGDSSEKSHPEAFTHIRVLLFPDGGIARFRLYGKVKPSLQGSSSGTIDLAAMSNGGIALQCSDQHFGSMNNLLLPGRGIDMRDGWATRRTRGPHEDWVIVALGAPGYINKVIVDTAFYRGNFPREFQVFGLPYTPGTKVSSINPEPFDKKWMMVTPFSPGKPDYQHVFDSNQLVHLSQKSGGSADSNGGDIMFSHVKLIIIPDGCVKRLRVYGRAAS